MKNRIVELQVSGPYALFSTPPSKCSGDKTSYMVPTYEALKGILKACYWKPTFDYQILEVRVMNEIRMEPRGIRVSKMNGEVDRANYTYLKDVCYQIRAMLVWDDAHPELIKDRNEKKHMDILRRSIKRGGRMNPCLGVSECQAYVEPCNYEADAEKSFYFKVGSMNFGSMFHSFLYPNQLSEEDKKRLGSPNSMLTMYDNVIMEHGVIRFHSPRDKRMMLADTTELSYYKHITYKAGENFTPADKEAI